MTIPMQPHMKHRKAQPSRKVAYWNAASKARAGNLTTNLTQPQVEQLARFNHDGLKRHKFHQEREVLMANIKKKQRISTYEGELNRFEHHRIQHGNQALNREQNARLEQLKTLLGK